MARGYCLPGGRSVKSMALARAMLPSSASMECSVRSMAKPCEILCPASAANSFGKGRRLLRQQLRDFVQPLVGGVAKE